MDYLLAGMVLVTMFFTLRSNYKISNLEEKQKKLNQQQKEDVVRVLSKVHMNVEAMDKKMVFFQKSLNDLKNSNDMIAKKNLSILKKQLDSIKGDTDLIKSIYLKPEANNNEKKEQLLVNETNKTSIIQEKKEKETESTTQEKNYIETFNSKVKEKVKNMSPDEKWILKQLLINDPLNWQNVSELEDDVEMLKFKIPKLSRQFIIDGLPILMIKHAGEKMYVKWGEGLTREKMENIQNEIGGDW
ncbi:MAG: hypothetical protein ACOC4J_00875 [Bacteroidota bacterium]